ncbi:MAG: methyltransferase domain-containing protein [Chloroflexota bacterium]|nr:methyltransferase domain-containing protein [Chloroflexota bacterium]
MAKPNPETLVARLKRSGVPMDSALEAALIAVQRHQFLPGVPLAQAYADASVPLKHDAVGMVEIASTQPGMTARMLMQLRLRPGQNVLQVGAGSGYTAALIQQIVGDEGRVTAIELDPAVAQTAMDNFQRTLMGRVLVVQGDAVQGYAPRANYDRILVNASVWDVPDAWIRQLMPDGVMVAPMWLDALQYSAAFTLGENNSLYSKDNVPCSFVPLRGSAQGPRTTLRIGGSSLVLIGDTTRLDSAALHTLMSEAAETDYLSTPLSNSLKKRNFLPYMMLNLSPEFTFCLYSFEGAQLPYGMNRTGFAVLARGSAAFISLEGDFRSFVFGGSDAFIAAVETFNRWRAARLPGDDRLRLRLGSIGVEDDEVPQHTSYRVYPRADRDLHVWLE